MRHPKLIGMFAVCMGQCYVCETITLHHVNRLPQSIVNRIIKSVYKRPFPRSVAIHAFFINFKNGSSHKEIQLSIRIYSFKKSVYNLHVLRKQSGFLVDSTASFKLKKKKLLRKSFKKSWKKVKKNCFYKTFDFVELKKNLMVKMMCTAEASLENFPIPFEEVKQCDYSLTFHLKSYINNKQLNAVIFFLIVVRKLTIPKYCLIIFLPIGQMH